MLKEEIGFVHGVPENPDKTWEKAINGRTFKFVKERVGKNGIFLYNCARYGNGSASSRGFHSLTPDEVEHLPQFAAFIAANS